MTEPLSTSQQISTGVSRDTLTSPLLYLSSSEAGWEGLLAQAFYEPTQLEGWMAPAMPDISLILFAGGAMRIEQRYAYGPWKAASIHQEDFILRPSMSSSYEVRWKSLSSVPTRTLHLHLSRDLLFRVAEEVADYDPAHLPLEGRSGFQDPMLAQIGWALWRELASPSPVGKLYAQTAAHMLALHLLRDYTSGRKTLKEPSQGLTHQQLQRVVDFVQAHLSQDLSLEALAQQAGFSPYHFARQFRQVMGESPHQFVLRQRIERAYHLLKKRDLPLAHVALESGFANQSHLTQVFKRYFGQTPRAFRQDHFIRADF